MKKFGILIFIIFVCLFFITGCSNSKTLEKRPANLKKITGKVVKATLDNNGNIEIKKDDITDKVMYIDYKVSKTTIGLLAVRNSKGEVKVVVNTCQSCGGAPYAYFVQVGNKIQCQNCGSMFLIDDLDDLGEGSCSPISLEEKEELDDKIIIKKEQLVKLKDKFKNWKGPKV